MKRLRNPLFPIVGLLAGALTLAACGDSTPEEGAPAATSEAARKQQPAPSPGIDPANKVITVGMLNDESGPAAAIGRPYAVGKRMLLRQVNAGGSGLLPEGWTLKFVERDHGYNPQRSVQLFNEIRDEVLFIGTSFGTPNTLPLRPLLERHKIVAFPASLSSKMDEFAYTPPLGPNYKMEVGRGIDWILENVGDKSKLRLGIVYQQDDYGQDGLEAAVAATQALGIEIVSKQTYAAGQPDFTALVTALKQAKVTHVVLTALPSATGPILGVAAQLDFKPVWVGNNPSWLDRFYDPKVVPPAIFENYYWICGTAFWGEDVPFVKQFEQVYEKFGKEEAAPDYYLMMSYAQGVASLEVAKRMIESGNLSREGYLKALQSMDDYDPQGAVADAPDFSSLPYTAGTRTRILKPDFANRSWTVVGDWASPSTLEKLAARK